MVNLSIPDLALGPDPDIPGEVLAHRADCPMVRQQADAGDPVATLFGCEQPLPSHVKLHTCLSGEVVYGTTARTHS